MSLSFLTNSSVVIRKDAHRVGLAARVSMVCGTASAARRATMAVAAAWADLFRADLPTLGWTARQTSHRRDRSFSEAAHSAARGRRRVRAVDRGVLVSTNETYTRAPRDGKREGCSAVTEPRTWFDEGQRHDRRAQLRGPLRLMTGCLTVPYFEHLLVTDRSAAQDRAPDYAAIVAAPDRTERNVQTGATRPVKLLAFTARIPA